MQPLQNQPPTPRRVEIEQLVERALGADVLADSGTGVIAIMSRSNPQVRQDVAAAFEMLALLAHFLPQLPLRETSLASATQPLEPAVHFDDVGGRLVALIPVAPTELDAIAYWVGGGIHSETVRAMGGILALPFALEQHDGVFHLVPEWFAAFYVDGNPSHCVPSLTLRSVTQDERFSDWVGVALERMPAFGLPSEQARASTRHAPNPAV